MFRYLVLTKRTPQFDVSVVEHHLAFLDELRQQGLIELSGAFTDKTGGAYILKADSFEEASAIAMTDPLHTTNASFVSVHEWNAK